MFGINATQLLAVAFAMTAVLASPTPQDPNERVPQLRVFYCKRIEFDGECATQKIGIHRCGMICPFPLPLPVPRMSLSLAFGRKADAVQPLFQRTSRTASRTRSARSRIWTRTSTTARGTCTSAIPLTTLCSPHGDCCLVSAVAHQGANHSKPNCEAGPSYTNQDDADLADGNGQFDDSISSIRC